MPSECELRIGTSGWHYKHWIGDAKFYPPRFPPAKMLSRYAEEFDTVEINNSFYRLPEENTFQRWRESVPPGFLFAVKASRFLTHIKRLKDPEGPIELFFSRARYLGPTLGSILFQLPTNWKADMARLDYFLHALPNGYRYALEFRDQSWLSAEVLKLLHKNNVALCLHDWREGPWPLELTADFTYIRFHGFGAPYGGNYQRDVLRKWADRIEGWKQQLSAISVYFNNDAHGYAIANAQTLRSMLGSKSILTSAGPSVAA
jgi:uncharacterized protein YecE (DUF72 family)